MISIDFSCLPHSEIVKAIQGQCYLPATDRQFEIQFGQCRIEDLAVLILVVRKQVLFWRIHGSVNIQELLAESPWPDLTSCGLWQISIGNDGDIKWIQKFKIWGSPCI